MFWMLSFVLRFMLALCVADWLHMIDPTSVIVPRTVLVIVSPATFSLSVFWGDVGEARIAVGFLQYLFDSSEHALAESNSVG